MFRFKQYDKKNTFYRKLDCESTQRERRRQIDQRYLLRTGGR